MKKLFFALTTLLAVDAMALAVTPFELPQMNHDTVGTLYKSADHKSGVFVVEAYFLNCPYCNDNAENVDDARFCGSIRRAAPRAARPRRPASRCAARG
jgi:hypothetical protein